MRKLRYVLLFNMVILLMIGCSKQETQIEPQQLDDKSDLKSAGFVPFKGEYDVYIAEVIHPGPPPPKNLHTKGEGKATHLGKSDVFLDQFWYPPGPPPLTFPWTGTGYGFMTFTAANGDLLKAEYTGAKAIHYSGTEVVVNLTAQIIDGGTGRFTYASGSFDWQVLFNPVINQGKATLKGEIMYGHNP